MSNRLGRTESRIHTLHELRGVTAAMRGIAAVRAREAEGQLAGVARHAGIVAAAIGDALAVAGARPAARAVQPGQGPVLVLLVVSQSGFVGALNERVIASARAQLELPARVLAVGGHGLRVAAEQGVTVAWDRPMAVHAALVPALAREVGQEMLHVLSQAAPRALAVVHGEVQPGSGLGVTVRQLLPFDFARFGRATATLPRVQVPLDQLLSALTAQYLHTEIQAALLLGLLAENTARLDAVNAMHTNLDRKLEAAHAEYRSLRQEEITAEILELSGGRVQAAELARRARSSAGTAAQADDSGA